MCVLIPAVFAISVIPLSINVKRTLLKHDHIAVALRYGVLLVVLLCILLAESLLIQNAKYICLVCVSVFANVSVASDPDS